MDKVVFCQPRFRRHKRVSREREKDRERGQREIERGRERGERGR